MQFCLFAAVAIGALWVRRNEGHMPRYDRHVPNIGRYGWIPLALALTTIGLLVFSDQFSRLWRPLSGELDFYLVSWRVAILVVFLLDIICVAILVYLTGESYLSPFTPAYFILPAMAFFLREPNRRVISYTVFIVISFILGIGRPQPGPEEAPNQTGAYAFISVCCLAISVVVGYLTRPR